MIDLTALLDPFRNAVSKTKYLPDDYNQQNNFIDGSYIYNIILFKNECVLLYL